MISIDRQRPDALTAAAAPAPESGQMARILALGLVLAGWLAILLSFRTYVAMVLEAWETLPSHAHGYVVLVIVAYLLWGKRAALQQLAVRPSWKGFAFLALMASAALLGEMASVAGMVQFAIVFMMFGAVWAVAGDRAARVVLGPLSFLLFAVPFGHEVLPTLMNWTADATVVAVRYSGVPVFQEGRNFVIPSGSWSVIEACGGIRYLLSSVFIGALFAYLTYTRAYKRALFMLWSVIMPLFANWLRAYIIVMVAHLTANEWGLGMSHLALGWLIFGVAIFVSFAVGMRWRDPLPEPPAVSPGRAAGAGSLLAAGVLAVLIPVGLQALSAPAADAPAGPEPVLELSSLATLEQVSVQPDGVSPNFPGARVQYRASYVYKGDIVDVYIAYYRNQHQGAELVSVLNKFEPSGAWSWATSSTPGLAHPALPGMLLEGYVKNGRHAAMHRLNWVNGTTVTSDLGSKLLEVQSRLQGHGDDAAFIAITAYSPENLESARRKSEAFAADYLAGILGDLAHTAAAGRGSSR